MSSGGIKGSHFACFSSATHFPLRRYRKSVADSVCIGDGYSAGVCVLGVFLFLPQFIVKDHCHSDQTVVKLC